MSKADYSLSSPVIIAEGLGKTYRTGFWLNQSVSSLQNCSLTVNRGETFGILGANGAGKTTLLKILLGIIRPTAGSGTILGQALGDRATKQKIGYLPENAYYYDYLTGWELLDFLGSLFQIEPVQRRQRIAELLDLVGLPQSAARKKQIRQYSKGMVQRIGVAQALINDPELIFLDEPMSGLDPVGRYQIREIILKLKQQQKTVFFNTHILSDVEIVCDRIGILNRGELICLGSLDQLLGTSQTYQVQGKGSNPEQLQPWISNLTFAADTWRGELTGEPQAFIAALSHTSGHLTHLQEARPTLEEFFIQQIRQAGHRS
ncbi:MAG: ABC transporter ATP-binding protein [Pseudanabaenaceae cyanobacterium bins.68]|nr:ABC transporter ATP-binding protein [Pseudanabaenaceae cyanobacterium bins.68]